MEGLKNRLKRYRNYASGMAVEVTAILVIMLAALLLSWLLVSWYR